jgi:hypothetical protein
MIKEVTRKQMPYEDSWGWAWHGLGRAYVLESLPDLIKDHIKVHEQYHLDDDIMDGYWKRELRANMHSFKKKPIGGIAAILLSLITISRWKFYIRMIKRSAV